MVSGLGSLSAGFQVRCVIGLPGSTFFCSGGQPGDQTVGLVVVQHATDGDSVESADRHGDFTRVACIGDPEHHVDAGAIFWGLSVSVVRCARDGVLH